MLRTMLVALLLICLLGLPTLNAQSNSTPKQNRFEFSYQTSINVPANTKKVALWLPLPQSDANQEITNLSIDSSYPVSFNSDAEYHNALLYFSKDAPPAGPLTVKLKFQVLRREAINRPTAALSASDADANDPLMSRWLQPDKLVPIDKWVHDLAIEVTAGKQSDLEKVRAIYDYAVSNLKYDKSGTGWGRGDIYYACNAKQGNCTDFHALVIGLCRSLNIPARFEIGFPIPADKNSGQIAGYHCWAEAYIKGIGWLPMDASEASKDPQKRDYFFGTLDENRVQFTIGRDVPLQPAAHSEPLNYFIYPYAEIDNKPVAQLEKTFTFQRL